MEGMPGEEMMENERRKKDGRKKGKGEELPVWNPGSKNFYFNFWNLFYGFFTFHFIL